MIVSMCVACQAPPDTIPFPQPLLDAGFPPPPLGRLERIQCGTYAIEWECLEGCLGGSPWQSQDRLVFEPLGGSFQRTTCGEDCAIVYELEEYSERRAVLLVTQDWPLLVDPIELLLVDGELMAFVSYQQFKGDPFNRLWVMTGELLQGDHRGPLVTDS